MFCYRIFVRGTKAAARLVLREAMAAFSQFAVVLWGHRPI